jgi:hypothetical protein
VLIAIAGIGLQGSVQDASPAPGNESGQAISHTAPDKSVKRDAGQSNPDFEVVFFYELVYNLFDSGSDGENSSSGLFVTEVLQFLLKRFEI